MSATRMRWFVLPFAAGLLLLAGAGGCGDDDGDAPFDPRQAASDAADALESAETFRFELTHENGSTEIIQDMRMTGARGEVQRPDRLRADIEVTLLGQLLEIEVVGVGDQVWLSNPFAPDQWQIAPDAKTSDVLDLTALPDVLRGVEDPQANGTEELEGQPHYRVLASLASDSFDAVVPAAAEPGQTVEVEIWVGRDDSYTRRIVLRGPLNGDESADIERRLELSGFGDPISIEPPE